ncbi:release factor glutamine methyltransferase [Agrococcus baldri]|uniref:Release factor glutamine methyltransferase n=1 Tax=Agrococcus baldri TaxID=153730 RepID=A0AA94HJX5_9MICO|nr:methyltransferase [Agrococcus baldri]SFR97733.1 release factor glutamine methyltransferase [Agrococcus baldri]
MEPAAPHGYDAEEAELLAKLRGAGSVFAEEELAELQAAAEVDDDLEALRFFVERRTLGEPIEHIVGSAAFAELRVAVHAGVFVPRRRTLLLATIVADRLRELADRRAPGEPAPRLLDLGCGTGAIAALAMHRVPGIEVVAIDSDPAAVRCAQVNLPGAVVVRADEIEALHGLPAPGSIAPGADGPGPDAPGTGAPAGTGASALFDVIAANLPYVPSAELVHLPHDTLEYESALALDGGFDGLDPLGEHATAMAAHLRTGGIAVTEVAPHQVETAAAILEAVGFSAIEVRGDDEIGATALIATR